MKTYKNLFSNSTLACSFLSSSVPLIGYKPIVEELLSISTEHGIPSKIFVPESKIDLVNWYSKIFEGISFEVTNLDSLIAIKEDLEKKYHRVIVVAEDKKGILFEDTSFIGVRINNTPPARNFKTFSQQYESYLSVKEIRELYQEAFNVPTYSTLKTQISEERDSFYKGETHQIGCIVEDSSGCLLEVLGRGTNYLQCVNVEGELVRKFPSDIKETARSINYTEGSFFKGYTPSKEFINSPSIMESFGRTIEDYNNGEIQDAVAILKSIRLVESLLEGKETESAALSALSRINQTHNHPYLKEMQDSKLQIATVIANSFGVKYNSTDPEDIVNNTILVTKRHGSSNRMRVLVNMLDIAKKAGVKFDQSLLESTDDFKRLHKDYKELKGKTTDQVLKDHSDMQKLGVGYSARDVGGKRNMITDILSNTHGANKVKTYKELTHRIKASMDETTFYGSARAAEHHWASGASGGEFANHSPNATSKNVYKLIDNKSKKLISTHGSTLDALAARKKLRGTSDTHSIVKEALNEVHLDPDYAEEIEILGYDKLKELLAKITGVSGYGDQEPSNRVGSSMSSSDETHRKMKVSHLQHPE